MLRPTDARAQRAALKRIFTRRGHGAAVMTRLDTPTLDRFAAALLQPATLAERGVHAPFTTPALFAARLRQGPTHAAEVVMASPSGRRGWLVLPWPAALDACQPSLADRALVARLGREALSPDTVRAAARAVALDGLAGRRARRAAASAAATPAPVRFAQALLDWCPEAPLEEDRRAATTLAARLGAAVGAAAQSEATRAAWVLDGWALLAALWQVGEAEHRPALLRRSVALCPLPSEDMLAWPGCAALGGSPPAAGAPLRFATQAQCERALAAWLSPR
jgi:hypothetical protein